MNILSVVKRVASSGAPVVTVCILLVSCLFENDKGGSKPVPVSEGKVRFDTIFYTGSKKPYRIIRYVDSLREGIEWSLYETGELEGFGFSERNIRRGWAIGFFKNGKPRIEYFIKDLIIVCSKQFSETGDLLVHDPICLDELYADSTYTVWKKHLAEGGR